MQVNYELYLQSTANCIKFAEYIDKNIREINRRNIYIAVENVTNNMSNRTKSVFKKYNIKRLPAMVGQRGPAIIGIENITKVLTMPAAGVSNDSAIPMDVTDYQMKEVFSGFPPKGGFSSSKNEEEAEEYDLDKAMREYNRKTPKHRVPIDYGEETQPTQPANNGRVSEDRWDEGSGGKNEVTSGDNVDPDRPIVSYGNDVDDKMLAAWMANMPATSDY